MRELNTPLNTPQVKRLSILVVVGQARPGAGERPEMMERIGARDTEEENDAPGASCAPSVTTAPQRIPSRLVGPRRVCARPRVYSLNLALSKGH